MMEKKLQFSLEEVCRYDGVGEVWMSKRRSMESDNVNDAPIYATPIEDHANMSSLTKGQSAVAERPVYRNRPLAMLTVSAFGPRHAKHARKLYQSKGTQSKHEVPNCSLPPYRTKVSRHKQFQVNTSSAFGPKHAEHYRKLQESVVVVNQRALYTNRVKVPFMAQPYVPILKAATISPRPSRKQKNVKSYTELPSQGLVKNEMSLSENEQDLSSASIFQILCEITNARDCAERRR